MPTVGSGRAPRHAGLDAGQREAAPVGEPHPVEFAAHVLGSPHLPEAGLRVAHDVLADPDDVLGASVDLGAAPGPSAPPFRGPSTQRLLSRCGASRRRRDSRERRRRPSEIRSGPARHRSPAAARRARWRGQFGRPADALALDRGTAAQRPRSRSPSVDRARAVERTRRGCHGRARLLPRPLRSRARGSSIRSARSPRKRAARAPSRARWSHDSVSIMVGWTAG